jgi:hypothetical protein
MQMPGTDDLALWCALNQVVAAYWADVDENGGLQAHEFYLPQGLFVIGNNRFEGKDKIEAFYARKSPFQGARPPAMIADFEARCVLGDDRQWRFQSHRLRPFIVGTDMPASIMINPRNF